MTTFASSRLGMFAAGSAAPPPVLLPEFVQAGAGYDAAGTGTHTLAYTCAVSPGADRLLLLLWKVNVNEDPPAFDAITYNGVAMSSGHYIRNTGPTPDILVAVSYLLHANIPNDGASHNFVIDFAAAGTSGLMGVPLEYIHVAQTAPHSVNQETSTTATPSLNLSTVTASSLLINAVGTNNTTNTSTPGTNQNERYDDLNGTRGSFHVSDRLPADVPGGTETMSMTLLNSTALAHVGLAWAPAG